VSVVFPRDLLVDFVELISGERLALFRLLVDPQFEFRELRLAEDGSLDPLRYSEKREADVVVADRLQHMLKQKRLVVCRSNLGHEDRIP